MLYLIDSNILIYAKMGVQNEQEIVSGWLTSTLANKEDSIAVCETSLLAFLRISTNPKAFQPPLPVNEASEFVGQLLDHPGVQILRPLAGHYTELIAFMEKHDFTGNLVMDAHLAVLARDSGAVLVTRDEDFKDVPYLKKLNPLAI